MEVIVCILMLLTAFNFLLKQTFRKMRAVLLTAFPLALFAGLMWPYAIEQSGEQIAAWLQNPELMLDTAIFLTLEVGLQLAFCLLAVHVTYVSPVGKRLLWTYRLLYHFAGVLIFGVVFFCLTQLIFSLPGVSFRLVAWGFALVLLFLIPLGYKGLLWLLPEPELRLELLFMTNALVAVLGIVATVNGRTAMEATAAVNWEALAGCFLLWAAGGGIGWGVRVWKCRCRKRIF